jgi:hypothetical protein
MNLALLALTLLQVDPDNSNMWIIVIAVLVVLFLIVVAVAIGLVVFFVMRKKKKAQLPSEPAAAAAAVSEAYTPSLPEQPAPEPTPGVEPPASTYDTSEQEAGWPPTTNLPAAAEAPPALPIESEETEFDPSRTVAIVREPPTVEISYGKIKFVSGVLSGEEFQVEPAGAYIGREPSLAQIVVSDPRISKRHLWVGVRDGAVTIVDQESRNGTFINDPRSERVHEAKLNSGDVVIMGESDVARFEFHS